MSCFILSFATQPCIGPAGFKLEIFLLLSPKCRCDRWVPPVMPGKLQILYFFGVCVCVWCMFTCTEARGGGQAPCLLSHSLSPKAV